METQNKPYDPAPWFYFIFAFTCTMFLCSYLGLFPSDNTILFAIVLIVTLPFYVFAANFFSKAGNDMAATYCYVFGLLFGGLYGVASLVTAVAAHFGIFFDFEVQGFMFIAGGVFLLFTLPSNLFFDKVNTITWTACTVWCIAGGLWFFGVAPELNGMLNLVGCAITAAGGIYMMLDAIWAMCYGKHLPMGKPFIAMPGYESNEE